MGCGSGQGRQSREQLQGASTEVNAGVGKKFSMVQGGKNGHCWWGGAQIYQNIMVGPECHSGDCNGGSGQASHALPSSAGKLALSNFGMRRHQRHKQDGTMVRHMFWSVKRRSGIGMKTKSIVKSLFSWFKREDGTSTYGCNNVIERKHESQCWGRGRTKILLFVCLLEFLGLWKVTGFCPRRISVL